MSNLSDFFKKIFRKNTIHVETKEEYEAHGSTARKIRNSVKHFKAFSITALIMFSLVFYYITLFPVNIKSLQFDSYLIIFITLLAFIFFVDSFVDAKSKKTYKFLAKTAGFLVVLIFVSNIYSSPIFHSGKYANMIVRETSDFAKDFPEADFNTLPVVDRDTAVKLGAREMGQMGELVSQYDIDETYSQINVAGRPVRITPLVYADFVKWFINRKNGIPYYIKIDMVSQYSNLVKPEKPIMYSMSDKFGRNLYRHVRFRYPTAIIGDINFELDDDGTPYFICPALEPTIGLFGASDVKYVITVNATTGETAKYPPGEVPTWVDRVYPPSLIIDQLYNNGQYQKGFINSKIKQDGVTVPTNGYNYITKGDDIYLYTGITSVLQDESNVGFVFVNTRTKETFFYPVSSAEEFSVMESAAGTVQEKGYTATFPILINIGGRPTYFMALKDAAKLTKMYSLVDAQSYQKVAVGYTIDETVSRYMKITTDLETTAKKNEEKVIKVSDIQPVVIDGNTIYYITTQNDDVIYTCTIEVSPALPFVKSGDLLSIKGAKKSNVFVIHEIN